MHCRTGRAFSFAAVAAGLGILALQASAQQAKFNLPVEAHWGSAVLEPGDYTVSLPQADSAAHIFHLFGDGHGSMVMPTTTEPKPITNHSYLELVKVDGTYYVREYKSGHTGKTFIFGVPKGTRESTFASAATTTIAAEEGTK